MRGLCAVSAILAASAGLDAEQATTLYLFATPMPEMNSATLRNEIEQGLMIERAEFPGVHRNARCSIGNRKSAIEN
jgi:hypothetical protein